MPVRYYVNSGFQNKRRHAIQSFYRCKGMKKNIYDQDKYVFSTFFKVAGMIYIMLNINILNMCFVNISSYPSLRRGLL